MPTLVKDVNRRLVTGDVQVQTLLLSASAAGLSAFYTVKLPARLIEMPYTPFYLHTLTYAVVRPPAASALSSSGETDGDSEFGSKQTFGVVSELGTQSSQDFQD